MQNHRIVAALVSVVAPVATAQTELCLLFNTTNGTDWTLMAELLNPTQTVLATISDLGFTMFGTNIANFEYNPAFDSDFFGMANVIATPTSVDFRGGNTLPPLNNAGGVDSGNPLFIASFTADSISDLWLNGEVSGAYVGVPFPVILIYNGVVGQADTPWSFKVIPAPSSIALLGLAGFASRRRR